jgi:hypothetical protein
MAYTLNTPAAVFFHTLFISITMTQVTVLSVQVVNTLASYSGSPGFNSLPGEQTS